MENFFQGANWPGHRPMACQTWLASWGDGKRIFSTLDMYFWYAVPSSFASWSCNQKMSPTNSPQIVSALCTHGFYIKNPWVPLLLLHADGGHHWCMYWQQPSASKITCKNTAYNHISPYTAMHNHISPYTAIDSHRQPKTARYTQNNYIYSHIQPCTAKSTI